MIMKELIVVAKVSGRSGCTARKISKSRACMDAIGVFSLIER